MPSSPKLSNLGSPLNQDLAAELEEEVAEAALNPKP